MVHRQISKLEVAIQKVLFRVSFQPSRISIPGSCNAPIPAIFAQWELSTFENAWKSETFLGSSNSTRNATRRLTAGGREENNTIWAKIYWAHVSNCRPISSVGPLFAPQIPYPQSSVGLQVCIASIVIGPSNLTDDREEKSQASNAFSGLPKIFVV